MSDSEGSDQDIESGAWDEAEGPGVGPTDSAPQDESAGKGASREPDGEAAGDVIDRYELLQRIGEGGMGTVWMAQQSEPVKRRVALKIIKLGMDTREVVVRFEAERQALALMDHPHIARVFDGGATRRGRPYFVMELVKGVPITEYCDRARLGLRSRLELFAEVCEAIQHAHHKGVIHRDIKPSNVMVTLHDGKPVPKVIDFGIAKATSAELTQKTLFTQHAQIIGTPEYMAPEQAEVSGLDIDTRADVYSLGVLLYELLTGTKPFDMQSLLEAGYDELLRTIREVDPAKPSTRISTLGESATPIALNRHIDVRALCRRLHGDLDWIVMRSLEKERTRRYETPHSFAADIARYLNGETVEAHPPGGIYRLRKFIGRRRKTVIAVAAILFLLVGGSIGTGVGWWKTVRANQRLDIALEQKGEALLNEEQQRMLAEANEQRARDAERAATTEAARATKAEQEAAVRAQELEQVVDFQAEQLGAIDPALMGIRMRSALREAVSEGRREVLDQSLFDVNFTEFALRTLQDSLFSQAIEAIDAQFADQPLVQAQLLQSISETLLLLGLFEMAVDPQDRALKIRREILGDEHPSTLESLAESAWLLHERGKWSEAMPLFEEVLVGCRRALGELHPETLRALYRVGRIHMTLRQYAEAEPYYREVLEKSRRVLGDEHEVTLLAIMGNGALLQFQGDLAAAEILLREAFATWRRLLGDEDRSTLYAKTRVGIVLKDQGRLEEAEPFLREVLDTSRRVLGDAHPKTPSLLYELGILLHLTPSKYSEAESCFREALDLHRRLYGREHYIPLLTLTELGHLLMVQGRLSEAEPLLREALLGRQRTLGAEDSYTHDSVLFLEELLELRITRERRAVAMGTSEATGLAGDLAEYGALRLLAAKFFETEAALADAEAALAEAWELFEGLGMEETWQAMQVRTNLGRAIAGQGRFEEAEVLVGVSAEWVLTCDSLPSVEQAGRAEAVGGADVGGHALESVIELYEAWNAAEPGAGHEEEAEVWREELEAWRADRAEAGSIAR